MLCLVRRKGNLVPACRPMMEMEDDAGMVTAALFLA
jgi:hypothetical protein